MPAPTTVLRRRPRTINKREEVAFALVLAVVGFLLTVAVLANLDSFRVAFAEWGQDDAAQLTTAPAE
jgi:hypothetical protein